VADNSKALIQQAKALVESGKFDQAVPLLDQALEQNPRRATGWFIRGVALTQLQQFTEAVESYTQALALNPKLPKVWYFKARSQFDQQLFADCVESCQQGLTVADDNQQLQTSLNSLLEQAQTQLGGEAGMVSLTPVAQQVAQTPPDRPTAISSIDDDEEEEEVTPFQREAGGTEPEMDMTPMVDVTFLLLIFFMVTAAFNLQKSLVIPTPQPEESSTIPPPQPEEDPDTMTIHVDEYNTYRVEIGDEEQEAASEHELYRQVRRLVNAANKSSPPKKLIVVANEEALHGKIVTALDAGMSVGMEQIQLRTVEEDE